MFAAIISGLGEGAVLALLAIGVVLVYKGSKVLNLAQGEMGALAFLIAMRVLGHRTTLAAGIAILLLTVFLGAIIGIVMERLVMRPLVDRPPVQGTMATLGVAIILIQFEFLMGGVLFLPEGQIDYPIATDQIQTAGSFVLRFGGASLVAGRVIAMIATAAIAVGLYAFFTKTKFGLGVVAATSDGTVARILGIPVKKVYRFTWGVGGALSGLAAALVAPALISFVPSTMTFLVIAALAAAVVGGLDSVWGAVVGGLLVGVVGALARTYIAVGSIDTVAVLVLVVVTLMLRPRGILGGAGAEI